MQASSKHCRIPKGGGRYKALHESEFQVSKTSKKCAKETSLMPN